MAFCGQLFGRRYLAESTIGTGSFGTVYLGRDTVNGTQVAIKVEKGAKANGQLSAEARYLSLLRHGRGIPQVHWFGFNYNKQVLVMELLGKNLEQLREPQRVLSLKTTILLAIQMLERLEFVHDTDLVHRDIKPENFMMGTNAQSSTLYLIDFGLSKKYRDRNLGIQTACRQTCGMVGTARYASVNAHLGLELSRRDDLESVGYVLVYLVKGRLPWQRDHSQSKLGRYRKIGDQKIHMRVENLCAELPAEFVQYFQYCRSLQFDERPDYTHLIQLFRRIAAQHHFSLNNRFDWDPKRKRSNSSRRSRHKHSPEPTPVLETIEDCTGPEFCNREEIAEQCFALLAPQALTGVAECRVFYVTTDRVSALGLGEVQGFCLGQIGLSLEQHLGFPAV